MPKRKTFRDSEKMSGRNERRKEKKLRVKERTAGKPEQV